MLGVIGAGPHKSVLVPGYLLDGVGMGRHQGRKRALLRGRRQQQQQQQQVKIVNLGESERVGTSSSEFERVRASQSEWLLQLRLSEFGRDRAGLGDIERVRTS